MYLYLSYLSHKVNIRARKIRARKAAKIIVGLGRSKRSGIYTAKKQNEYPNIIVQA
jgi:hypothetical protein